MKIVSLIKAACIVLVINFILYYSLCIIIEPDSEPYPQNATFEEVIIGLSEMRTIDDYCTNGWRSFEKNRDSYFVRDMPESVLRQTFSKVNKFEMVFVSLLQNRFNAKLSIMPSTLVNDEKETLSVDFVRLFGNEYLVVDYTNRDIYTSEYNLFGITRVVYKAEDSIYSELQKYEKPKESYHETFPIICSAFFSISSWRGVLLYIVFIAEFCFLYKFLRRTGDIKRKNNARDVSKPLKKPD